MADATVQDPGGHGLRRIVVAVALCLVVLVGLAAWVIAVPVTVELAGWNNGGAPLDCDHIDSVDIGRLRTEAEQVCGDAESTRRNMALIAGGIAVTVAFAASTWPSRRLTGEELGPIR